MPQPQQVGIWASSATYTTAHGNPGSLTHWEKPGIEPLSWCILGYRLRRKQFKSFRTPGGYWASTLDTKLSKTALVCAHILRRRQGLPGSASSRNDGRKAQGTSGTADKRVPWGRALGSQENSQVNKKSDHCRWAWAPKCEVGLGKRDDQQQLPGPPMLSRPRGLHWNGVHWRGGCFSPQGDQSVQRGKVCGRVHGAELGCVW